MRSLYVILFMFLFSSFSVYADKLYFVDAHSQFERDLEGDEIIQKMNEAGVRQSIISTRRGRKAWDAVELASQYPERIIPSVRIKSKHYKKDSNKFYKKLRKQAESDEFMAMSEVHMFHAQKGDKADEVKVHGDDDRIQESLSAAIDNGWPFVVHIEFASLSSDDAIIFMNELEKLLTDNPEHPFALIHMGQLEPARVEPLLKKYKNLYFITSHADTVTANNSNQPWINMFDGEKIKPQWTVLMLEYPSRFVFAVDAVWADQWRDDYVNHVELWRKGLSFLPEDVANKIAHGNAEYLWKLKN